MRRSRLLSPGSPCAFIFIYAILTALLATPLLAVNWPPVMDYQNHLARIYVLHNLAESANLSLYYEKNFNFVPNLKFVPNLAMDIITTLFYNFMEIELAGKLFILTTIVVFLSGPLIVNYAVSRRFSSLSLLPLLFLYNEIFIKGFLNFILGTGISLIGYGVWLMMVKSNFRHTHMFQAHILHAVFCVVTFVTHLYAFAIYVILVGSAIIHRMVKLYYISSKRDVKRMLFDNCILPSLPIILLIFAFFLLSPTSDSSFALSYGHVPTLIINRLRNFAGGNFVYSTTLSYGLAIVVVAGLGAAALLGKVRVAPESAIALATLTILYFGLPNRLISGSNVGDRMAIVLVLVAVSSCFIDHARVQWPRSVTVVVLAVLAAQLAIVTTSWMRYDAQYQAIVSAFDNMEHGARITAAVAYDDGFLEPPLDHVACLATIRRDAFCPFLFAIEGQHPLKFATSVQPVQRRTPAPRFYLRQIEELTRTSPRYPFQSDLLDFYDYVLVINGKRFGDLIPSELVPIVTSDNFVLYRTSSDSTGAGSP